MTKQTARGIALAATLLAACGPSVYEIRGTPTMPGVDGFVSVEDGPATNRTVTVQLDHLPPPARMEAGHAHYGVWFREADGQSIYAGNLAYDEGDRRGHLSATTPLHGFEVLITVERRPRPRGPSEHVVVRRRVD